MDLSEQRMFDELADKCGNRYLAVKFISKKARFLDSKLAKSVLISKLMTWVLTGREIDIESNINNLYKLNPDLIVMENYLEFVEDESVKRQVRKSYIASVRNRHLVYDTSEGLNRYKQNRANILLRMIWYQFELYAN